MQGNCKSVLPKVITESLGICITIASYVSTELTTWSKFRIHVYICNSPVLHAAFNDCDLDNLIRYHLTDVSIV